MRLPSVDMAGDYTGTCKAMLEGDSLPPKECRVDLSLSLSGIFRVTITSCDGYSAPSLARGFMLRSVVLSLNDSISRLLAFGFRIGFACFALWP